MCEDRFSIVTPESTRKEIIAAALGTLAEEAIFE
jgi:hypothetical protein